MIAGFVGICLLVVGTRLAWVAWHWCVDGLHPYCTKCGFDLFGRPAGADRCSECGTPLGHKGAIRIGRRRVHRGFTAAAMLMIAVGAMVLAPRVFPNFELRHHEPLWLLRRQAVGGDGAAFSELFRRSDAGALSQEQLNSLVEQALTLQADRSRPWDPRWDQFIVIADRNGSLSPAQLERYAMQALDAKLIVRPRVRRGDPLPISIGSAFIEQRYTTAMELSQRTVPESELYVNGMRVVGSYFTDRDFFSALASRTAASSVDLTPWLRWLPNGTCEVKLVRRVEILRAAQHRPKVIHQVEQTLHASFELLPADVPSVEAIRDPVLESEMREGLTLVGLQYDGHDGPYVSLLYSIRRSRAEMAHEVFVVAPDGREWRLGAVTLSRTEMLSDRATSVGTYVPGFPSEGTAFDVVFRPRNNIAVGTTDVTRYWDHELRFNAIPVLNRQSPPLSATRPGSEAAP